MRLPVRLLEGLFVASRPLYLPGGVLLYGLGLLAAAGGGSARAIATGAVVVLLVHVLTHYVNDAEDVATDDRTTAPTAMTGGSRAIQRGLVTPRELRAAAAVLGVAIGGIAAFEVAVGASEEAALHLAILALAYSYSGPPLTLGRRGLGELTTAAVMGMLVPLAGGLAGGGPTRVLGALLPLLFAETFLARLCTAWPDLEADRDTGKVTIPVLLGPRRAGWAFVGAAGLVLAAGAFGVPALPAPAVQGAAAVAVGVTALMVGWAIVSGRAERRPVLVPMAGVAATGIGMMVPLLAFLGW